MDTIELLSKFADPEIMKALSLSDRLFAGLITTLLGMGITFMSLVILQIVIGLTAKLAAPKPIKEVSVQTKEASLQNPAEKQLPNDEDEIVAAITTALAVQLKTSVGNIIIRNIEKVGEPSSAWHKAGIAEHMNNSL